MPRTILRTGETEWLADISLLAQLRRRRAQPQDFIQHAHRIWYRPSSHGINRAICRLFEAGARESVGDAQGYRFYTGACLAILEDGRSSSEEFFDHTYHSFETISAADVEAFEARLSTNSDAMLPDKDAERDNIK